MEQDHSELRKQIRESLETKEEEVLIPVRVLVAKEFILAIIGAAVIGYIMDFMVVKPLLSGWDKVDLFFPYFTVIIMVFALLSAAYRCWRIRRGMNPDGNW